MHAHDTHFGVVKFYIEGLTQSGERSFTSTVHGATADAPVRGERGHSAEHASATARRRRAPRGGDEAHARRGERPRARRPGGAWGAVAFVIRGGERGAARARRAAAGDPTVGAAESGCNINGWRARGRRGPRPRLHCAARGGGDLHGRNKRAVEFVRAATNRARVDWSASGRNERVPSRRARTRPPAAKEKLGGETFGAFDRRSWSMPAQFRLLRPPVATAAISAPFRRAAPAPLACSLCAALSPPVAYHIFVEPSCPNELLPELLPAPAARCFIRGKAPLCLPDVPVVATRRLSAARHSCSSPDSCPDPRPTDPRPGLRACVPIALRMRTVDCSLQPSAFLFMASRRNQPFPCEQSRTNALLPDSLLSSLTDEEDGVEGAEDGVAVVMRMLDASPSTRAPIISPTNIDRIFANWDVDLCGAQTRFVVDTPPPYPSTSSPCDKRHGTERQWCYGEDCTVADVFTRVVPDRQKDEIKRRLPGRRWSEAVTRFRILCGEVVDNCGEDQKRKPFWRRGNRTETKLRIQCPIRKTWAKFR
ncbi:short-chain dehydrogenase/reductase [Gracilaria domingensis]|nr:short-chain dehydrogenase/reductase [Gracilaria domingensis]